MKRAKQLSVEAGYALVLVLWIVALLAVTVTAFARAQRVETQLAHADESGARARVLAESAIWLAAAQILTSTEPMDPSLALAVDDADVQVRIRPVNARINLNAADPGALDALLKTASVPDAERADLVARIADWRDADDERGARGLEDRDYKTLGLGYGAKDAPFYTVDELRYVPGIGELTYRAIADLVTVFGGGASVDPDFAAPEVLAAVPGLREARRDAGEAPRLAPNRAGVYELEATVGGDSRGRTVAVLQLARDNDPPFRVVSWTDAAGGGLGAAP